MTSLQDLTAADRALHEWELELLGSILFRDCSPKSLHIVGQPEIIGPSVTVCWYPEPPRRTLQKGGFRYSMQFPGATGPSQISVQHWAEDRYWLAARYLGCRGVSYTRFSITCALHELSGRFVRCIQEMEREFAMTSSWK